MARKINQPGVGKGRFKRELKTYQCKNCGGPFLASRSDALRCEQCKAKLHDRRPRPERKIRPDRFLICKDCGAPFQASRSDALRCADCKKLDAVRRCQIYNARRIDACPQCGRAKFLRAAKCRSCATIARGLQGVANPNWKGGRSRQGDYVLVRNPDATAQRHYVLEHRLVWEAAHGPIPKNWHVHHLNGVKNDNRLENLVAMSMADHHKNHHEPWENRIRDLEQAAGSNPPQLTSRPSAGDRERERKENNG